METFHTTKLRTLISITIPVMVQLMLIFFYLHHRSRIIQLHYLKQRQERKQALLLEQHKMLSYQLEQYHDLTTIKKYAEEKGMRITTLTNLQTVTPHAHISGKELL